MGPSQKDKLNIKACGFVKKNNVDGQIIAVVPDVPISAWLDDLLFIVTLPSEDNQKFAPAYVRLQSKSDNASTEAKDEIKELSEVRATGVLRSKVGDMIVCAPTAHVKVDLDKLVFIATVPADGKFSAPCYFKKRTYNYPNKDYNKDSVPPEKMEDIAEVIVEINNEDKSEMS